LKIRRGSKRQRRSRPPIEANDDPRSLFSLGVVYLDWLEVRNYSRYTIDVKGRYVRYFAEWCADRGITRPAEVTLPLLERYQRYLFHYRTQRKGEPLTIHSQRSRLAALRVFFKWLVRERYILANPASELVIPRKVTQLPRDILTVEEAEQVLRQPDLTDPLGLRDRTILEVLYATAIRRLELVALELRDIDLKRGTLMVRQGKGLKDRYVPLGERAQAWLEKYLAEVRPHLVIGNDDGTVFLNNWGERFHAQGVSHMARKMIRASGVDKKGACHIFRHTAATLMLEGGADVRYIQELLGHAEIETTQIYTHVSIEKLRTVHRLTHPAAQLRRRVDDGDGATEGSASEALLEDLYRSFAGEAEEDDEDAVGASASLSGS
jgi:integrase/recombinase XerD